MKLAPVLSILVAGLSFASAQVCPDKNLMECYEYCDTNNKPNEAFMRQIETRTTGAFVRASFGQGIDTQEHDDSSTKSTQDMWMVEVDNDDDHQDDMHASLKRDSVDCSFDGTSLDVTDLPADDSIEATPESWPLSPHSARPPAKCSPERPPCRPPCLPRSCRRLRDRSRPGQLRRSVFEGVQSVAATAQVQ
ncbi:hypothetical protein CSAL01_02783 [Colletotrichum salicis]|uniref:Uncharacterized protein n=1 Tax=Colletotrichum salicis TaxID=1209931 RepID=A0A135RWH5_9PEZI|nr:hypothetical protein CSAL01_02783 [Colletotrichum salicis]